MAGSDDGGAVLALHELQLLGVGVDDLGQARRGRGDLVGAGTRDQRRSGLVGSSGTEPDQLLGLRPVEATGSALRGVHALGYADAVTEQVPAEGDSRLPVNRRCLPGNIVGMHVGDHVRGSEHRARSEGSRVARVVHRLVHEVADSAAVHGGKHDLGRGARRARAVVRSELDGHAGSP